MSSRYPEPFNPNPPRFKRGDKVIDKDGHKGVVQGPEDFDGYEYNRPSGKWELVEYENVVKDTGNKFRVWVGNIWIKLR